MLLQLLSLVASSRVVWCWVWCWAGLWLRGSLCPVAAAQVEVSPPSLRSPKFELYFIHMRKAGGTEFTSLLSKYLRAHQCFRDRKDHVESYQDIIHGYFSGAKMDKSVPSPCPGVTFYHNEYACVDANAYLQAVESHRARSFTVFTTLRDPIERIGSLAFFERTGVGSKIMERELKHCALKSPTDVLSNCFSQGKLSKKMLEDCSCSVHAKHRALNQLQTNSTLWFDWIINGPVKSTKMKPKAMQHQEYESNYYLRRLTLCSGRNKIDKIEHAEPHPNLVVSCTSGSCHNKPRLSDSEALDVAKAWLRDRHVHFFVLEFLSDLVRSHEIQNAMALSSALNGDDVLKNLFLNESWFSTRANEGRIHKTGADADKRAMLSRLHENHLLNETLLFSSSYKLFMPADVLDYLYDHNAEDIQLYNYAKSLYSTEHESEN